MKTQIFYHMYCVNDCVERFFRTYIKILDSGLLNNCESINVVLVGDLEQTDNCRSKIEHLKKIKTQSNSINTNGEIATLNAIYEFCKNNTKDKILYLHSKGVTRGVNENVQAWVDYMEYFLIENYSSCLHLLETYDAVGVEYSKEPMPHYSGNFWWTNSSYIKEHKSFEQGLNESIIPDPKWYCEFWLLHHNNANPKCLHNSNTDLYGTLYSRQKYTKN